MGSRRVSRRAVVGGMLAAPMIARGASAQAALTVTWGEDDVAPRTYDPRVTSSRHEYQVIGQIFDTLVASDGTNKLFPGLATAWDVAADGKSVTLKLRSDVGFHDGTPFDAEAVKFTFDTILNPAVASDNRAILLDVFGGPDAYKVTGPLQLTIDLPRYSMMMREFVLSAVAILPLHAYADIRPEQLRSHSVNTWRAPWTVKTSKGSYTSKGAIGTGAWICGGFDPVRKSYSYTKNPNYWQKTAGNVATYYHVNINGTDAVLAALKSGEIDAHDPMYDVGPLSKTIDAAWGRIERFDSFKWQHICYNLRHPVFGTGVDTPLGKQDPGRAAEAAAYIRRAFSLAIPRQEIINQMAGGFGQPGTVPIPFSAPEYDHTGNKPIPFDMDLAKQMLARAGYS